MAIDYQINIKSSPDKNDAVTVEVTSHGKLIKDIQSVPGNASRVINALDSFLLAASKNHYKFEEMAVGETTHIPTNNPKSVMNSAYAHGSRHGSKFKCLALTAGRVRIRRIY